MIATAPAPTRDYLSTADTAKAIRRALADSFPTGRFTVRSHVYSGGSSIDIGYVDGPAYDTVKAVVSGFSGGGFDGMIDLAYYVDAYVDDKLRVLGTVSSGTAGSHGSVPAHDDGPFPGARLVHFGTSHVFVTRSFSPASADRRDAWIRDHYGVTDAYMAPPGAYRSADDAIGDLPFGALPPKR